MSKCPATFLLFLTLLHFPQLGHAKLGLKAGLWEIESSFNSDGKTYDPQAQMREAMAKMPKDQQQKMQAMMEQMGKNQGVSMGPNGHRICLDDQALSSARYLNPQDDKKKCDYKVDENNPKKISMTFNCQDGTTGVGTWELISDVAYKGSMSFTDKNKKKGLVNYNGKFLGSDCQGMKPISAQTKK